MRSSGKNLVRILNLVSLKIQVIEENLLDLLDGIPPEIVLN
jgi:hypothetical protein